MVMITLDIPKDINKEIEHFKIENELKDKREAIVILLKQCVLQKKPNMEYMFEEVNRMEAIKLSPKDLVRMKKEVYSQ